MNEGASDFIMTVEEVSEYLRLAQSTIYKLLDNGENHLNIKIKRSILDRAKACKNDQGSRSV